MANVPHNFYPDKSPTSAPSSPTPLSPAAAVWHTAHTEAHRQQAEQAGSFAALVCNPMWRMARER